MLSSPGEGFQSFHWEGVTFSLSVERRTEMYDVLKLLSRHGQMLGFDHLRETASGQDLDGPWS